MRKYILKQITNEYEEEIEEIRKIISNQKQISDYKYTVVNGSRRVIDKNTLNKDELVQLRYYQLLLEKTLKIKYPNRSYVMKEFMQIIPYLNNYFQYSILKFDFKNFFSNICPQKILDVLKNQNDLFEFEITFLSKYLEKQENISAGIGLHNCLAEYMGRKFDTMLLDKYSDNVIYYNRYIDDGILIFDRNMRSNDVLNELNDLIKETFGEYSSYNQEKTKFLNKSTEFEFDYLGYLVKNEKLGKEYHMLFGIADKKIEKNKILLKRYVEDYVNNKKELELFKLRLDFFYKRKVYLGKKKNQIKVKWQVRGITQNYRELRFFLPEISLLKDKFLNNNDLKQKKKHLSNVLRKKEEADDGNLTKINDVRSSIKDIKRDIKNDIGEEYFNFITEPTKKLLSGEIILELFSEIDQECPFEIKNNIYNYKYYSSFMKNKAVIFYKGIGLNKNQLEYILKKIGHPKNGLGYNDLVKELYKLL